MDWIKETLGYIIEGKKSLLTDTIFQITGGGATIPCSLCYKNTSIHALISMRNISAIRFNILSATGKLDHKKM